MKKDIFTLFIMLLIAGSGCRVESATGVSTHTPQAAKDVSTYSSTIDSISQKRISLAADYKRSTDKKAVITKARAQFINSVEKDIAPYWYGTEWDFYGTTETPQNGKIACGYFVTTVLRDAGLKLSRVSLAQQASENIIKSLTTAPHIKRYHNASIEKFVEGVKTNGEGLYIVGLDFHVGFILNDGGEVYFIHSSYAEPKVVMKEKALESAVLASSKYRVTGKISADDSLILKWLRQTAIPTIRR